MRIRHLLIAACVAAIVLGLVKVYPYVTYERPVFIENYRTYGLLAVSVNGERAALWTAHHKYRYIGETWVYRGSTYEVVSISGEKAYMRRIK